MREMHTLHKLEGELAEGYRIRVARRQLKKAEQSFFQVFITDKNGVESEQPVFEGLYSLGIKPYIDGWIDGHYYEELSFKGRKMNLSETELDFELFRKLGSTLKPSWSLMVAYESFWGKGRTLGETSKGLNCGIPPIATPLGYLLFTSGKLKVKDWYFPEGGNEGMPKLEGIGRVDRKHAARMKRETSAELGLFLKMGKCEDKELELPAKERARKILKSMKGR